MARMPNSPLPDKLEQKKDDRITQVREYRLITPLFGGGVKTGEADPVTIIRGSEIRGQLRFWWRATRGGQFGGDPKRMKEAEDLLWGAASTKKDSKPSCVQISVCVTNEGEERHPFIVVDKNGYASVQAQEHVAPSYAAFPLQPPQQPRPQIGMLTKSVLHGIRFTLTISFRATVDALDVAQEVSAALWAWETFGGVGARTRRGFGALQLISAVTLPDRQPVMIGGTSGQQLPLVPPADQQQIASWINKHLELFVPQGSVWPADVPHLEHTLGADHLKVTQVSANNSSDPLQHAFNRWNNLINALKDFRQQRAQVPATPRVPSHPGRNHWPEPDAIRVITSQSTPAHSSPISSDPNFPKEKFPRASFGLPIEVQFKDRNKDRPPNPDDSKSDPRKTGLNLHGLDRLSSPLILRPLICEGGKAVGLALVLQGTGLTPELIGKHPLELTAKEGSPMTRSVDPFLIPTEAQTIKKRDGRTPLLGLETNVLKAFLKTLK